MNILSDYINQDYKPLDVQESVAAVQDFFVEVPFSHFPVLEEGVFVGNLSSEDVETFDFDKKISDYKYTLEGFFTKNNAIWLDVLEVFAHNQSNILPVLDENNSYLGYYEIDDIIRFFNETPFLKEPGNILIIEKNTNEYSFSQISQIIEGNDGRLLGLFISDITNETVQITIKIAVGGMNEIIQTFRRYEYEIISEHQEDSYLKILQERSDYLDKYLNI
ncbi:CBS domain-containing protein [Flavobacterium humi]|uniref:CBS domain-containing protein n=1 Tax=Flavobacterium humi TaxID=2562683 RepID=A0A4Z0L5K6_9FLAO|nr:CBS domain-containing protein [Flavobacterium humi]TGD57243.1 CBS domain-containing protein [Flavobacterium humi]